MVFSNKGEIISVVNDLQLSANKVERRDHDISSDLYRQISGDLKRCSWYAARMDESLDVPVTAELALTTPNVFQDYTAKE
jgi:hypothetical protein